MSKYNITDAYIQALQENMTTKLPNASKVAKFLEESINWLVENQEGCCQYKLDNDLSIFVGWSDGYAEDDETVIHAKEDPTFAIVAGIKSNHDYLKTDYDWLNYPYDEETGDVWDTGISLSYDENLMETAQWYLEQYEAIREALNDGALVLESLKEDKKFRNPKEDRAIKTAFVGDNGVHYEEEPVADNDVGLNTKRNKVRNPEQATRNYARKEAEFDKDPDSTKIGNNDFSHATWEVSPNERIRYYQANKEYAEQARERGDDFWAKEHERTAQIHADKIRAKHTKKTESSAKSEIYDEISRVLTDYEEGFADDTDLYNALVKVQNRWEDTITACNESLKLEEHFLDYDNAVDMLQRGNLEDFQSYNEAFERGDFKGSEATPYKLDVIEKWIKIRDDYTYIKEYESGNWFSFDLKEYKTKYGLNTIYVEPDKKLWRITQTGDEFYGHAHNPVFKFENVKLQESAETYDDILAKIQDADESNIYKGLAEFVMWYMESHKDELAVDINYETVDVIAWELTDSEETDDILGNLTKQALIKYKYIKADTVTESTSLEEQKTNDYYVCGEGVSKVTGDTVRLAENELVTALRDNGIKASLYPEQNYGTWIDVSYMGIEDTLCFAIDDINQHDESEINLTLLSGGNFYENCDTESYKSLEDITNDSGRIDFNLIRCLDNESEYETAIDETGRISAYLPHVSTNNTMVLETLAKTMANDFRRAKAFIDEHFPDNK